ncbi:MAG: hypothetical protein ACD_30C00005G0008 [uncultured bacterium]|uniref:PT repeat-containing protein n=4 Tax=Candidatus Daviesiibacteriota TaxID=1752718 RepID=A0A0G0EPQ9_9BACT|nr:MAG: hypothetical protein ACD_30C00005G0008 [uncultured bacterium]KKQ07497.1 MAG: hypothetical protein US19_C0044G0014 [Candidatus Daviesbacteria bacterium GW2011_GWB1_36_5]KKQ15139.1 MAG: hypothetical protein US28_C0022G0011 [Candidatus Daviesbacteria bacterium GW2011_GWA1_36_8]OGE16630.1 MAG: hypothetical protein A2858_02175 [Candidatus Daviesbacteria bacterium RIFCSPHIGHO2_01_FULL_36_37]OGE33368.1 MAG: hypothetical protein A3C99_01605 [Candidatus Daviesbacteria bacterium RIFCSPHIGHO2_02_F
MFDKYLGNLNQTQKTLVLTIMAVVVYLVSTTASYSLFANLAFKAGSGTLTTSLPGPSQAVDEDPNVPKTESCPLDGSMHTKQAKDAWELRRPLAVMIENHTEARPQSGLSSANIVYEAVAEGGITRFMALFYCNLSDVQVGPVRSARTYYLDWLSEYDALYAHVGGANSPGPANALGQIIDYKIKDLNQFGIGFPTFWRDYQRLGRPVATEHTMYSTTQKLWEIGAKKGWAAVDAAGVKWDAKFIPWKFIEDAKPDTPQKIEVPFWQSQGDYTVEWNYDSTCNCYHRKNGSDHKDLNNDKQLSPKNVVIQFQKESRANDGYEGNAHLLYGTTGKGKALIFQNGKAIVGTWDKTNRLARTKYLDDKGKEVSFVKGQIWIQTVPEGNTVKY